MLPRNDGNPLSEKLRLCMYVGEQALMKILDKERLRLSCPWRTNDITECVSQNESYQDLEVKRFGYICLSEVYDSPKMWGLYAERSRGACLIFDFEVIKLDEETFEILEDGMSKINNRLLIRKIRYDDKRAQKRDIDILFRKSKTWADEKEYRIIFDLENFKGEIEHTNSDAYRINYYHSNLLNYLSHIVLGPKCQYNEIEIQSIIRNKYKNLPRVEVKTDSLLTLTTQIQPHIQFSTYISRAHFDAEDFSYNITLLESLEHLNNRSSYSNQKIKISSSWKLTTSVELNELCHLLECDFVSCYQSSFFIHFKGVREYLVLKAKQFSETDIVLFIEYDQESHEFKIDYNVEKEDLNNLLTDAESAFNALNKSNNE